MAIAPVLKTGVRKDIRVRIPGPPLQCTVLHRSPICLIDGLECSHGSSMDRGQSSLRSRDMARSASTRPPVWQRAQ